VRLTVHSDYAFRILIHLASRPEETTSVAAIAEAFGISTHHLAKVGLVLARAGFVESQRGAAGGMRLARSADAICLGDVLRKTEPDFHLVECFNAETNGCILTGACALQDVLRKAQRAFLEVLDGYTVADLIRSRTLRQRLLPR
jgi:Rrf2 family nitric oxide-sensitive transcriptional repressor